MILAFAIAAYRAWPFRPHCNAATRHHAWTCRTFHMAPDWCKDLPGPIPD